MCGCGQPTKIAKGTDSARGDVKGQPKRYVYGHAGRSTPIEHVADPVTGCWNWQRSRNNRGYGKQDIGGRRIYAHRAAWERAHGPIPAGLNVLHKCDNPACVNPSHLFLGTMADNSADMAAKGRSCRGEKHRKAKLTAGQVAIIRRRRATGEPARTIAAAFSVSRQNVADIVARRSWRHV